MKTQRALALAGLILLAVFSRFLPHPWNWTAIGGATLLAGARFRGVAPALLVPLIAMGLSDAVLGFHSTMGFVYGAILLTAFTAHLMAERLHGWRVLVGAVVASLFFFVVTNFGVWLVDGFYSRDLNGLLTCYTMGLPFLGNAMMGDLFYAALLFAAWDFADRRVFVRA